MMPINGINTAGTHHGHGKDMDFRHKRLTIGYDTSRRSQYITHVEVSVHRNYKVIIVIHNQLIKISRSRSFHNFSKTLKLNKPNSNIWNKAAKEHIFSVSQTNRKDGCIPLYLFKFMKFKQ